ncbi:MAG: phytanoyl-CoA dioxygenase family protein [Candidatus Melainabacteria bacterium]|nr:phytanoyl-CoA dioxygenase family protein [Candidatus Melainabacteria bacterium]
MKELEKKIYEIEVFGFTIVENAISKKEAVSLKRHLKTALELDMKKYDERPQKKEHHIVDLTSSAPIFLDLLDNDIMHEIFSRFLSDTCILYTYSSTILRPNETIDVHAIHIDTPRLIPNYYYAMQMTLALDDFTIENGATYYLPGSHKSELTPCEDIFNRYAVPTVRKAGDALFWNPRTYHRAGINSTDETRFAVSTYAVRSFMKQRFDFPRVVPKENLKGVSERVKRFLGFNTRVPASIDEYYVSPENRLYKANQG